MVHGAVHAVEPKGSGDLPQAGRHAVKLQVFLDIVEHLFLALGERAFGGSDASDTHLS